MLRFDVLYFATRFSPPISYENFKVPQFLFEYDVTNKVKLLNIAVIFPEISLSTLGYNCEITGIAYDMMTDWFQFLY